MISLSQKWKALQNYWTRTYPSWDNQEYYKETLTHTDARVFLVPFLPFFLMNNFWLFLLLLRNLWPCPWPPLPFFYKSERLRFGTILVVVDVAMKIPVTFAIFAKFADHKRVFFTFILLLTLLFLQYVLACFFLSNVNFSFRFLEFFGGSSLPLFRMNVCNMLFLVLIRYLLSVFLIAMKDEKSCYVCDFCEICCVLEFLLGLFSV